MTVTVTGYKYRKISEEYLLPLIQDLDMQNFCTSKMRHRTYGKGNHDISWSFNFLLWWCSIATTISWSPDLFLRAIFKENFYWKWPNYIQEIKRNNMHEISMITPPVLESASQNIVQRMRICSNYCGKNLNHIIFKKKTSGFPFCNLYDWPIFDSSFIITV